MLFCRESAFFFSDHWLLDGLTRVCTNFFRYVLVLWSLRVFQLLFLKIPFFLRLFFFVSFLLESISVSGFYTHSLFICFLSCFYFTLFGIIETFDFTTISSLFNLCHDTQSSLLRTLQRLPYLLCCFILQEKYIYYAFFSNSYSVFSWNPFTTLLDLLISYFIRVTKKKRKYELLSVFVCVTLISDGSLFEAAISFHVLFGHPLYGN